MKIIFILLFAISSRAADIQCWGNNFLDQLDAPTDLKAKKLDQDIVLVQTGESLTCTLNSAGTIKCWGSNYNLQDGLGKISNFALGQNEGAFCSLGEKATTCNRDSLSGAPALSAKAQIVIGDDLACALDNGAVLCWGNNSLQVPTVKNPTKIVANPTDVCVLDDEGVKCFNSNSQLGIGNVPTLDHPSDVVLTKSYACAQDKKGFRCWGQPDQVGFPPIPSMPATLSGKLVAGFSHICALDGDHVQCFGDNTFGQLNIPKLSHPKSIVTNAYSNHTCALDDNGLICWGADGFNQSSLKPFASIAAGYGNTCVIDGGRVRCWGKGADKIDAPIASSDDPTGVLGDATQVSLGSNFVCVNSQRETTNNSCFGDNIPLQQSSTSLPLNSNAGVTTLWSAGSEHACLSFGGAVTCGGANEFGQSTPPRDFVGTQLADNLASGGHHTCAIDAVKGVRCWGQNKYGQSSPPLDLKNPRSLSSGFAHSCALTDDGVRCWGRNDFGQTDVPKLANPKMVRAGGYHACAVDDTGVHCWGDNSFGQTKIPSGLGSKIADLTTGYLHSCAVTK